MVIKKEGAYYISSPVPHFSIRKKEIKKKITRFSLGTGENIWLALATNVDGV